MSELTAKSKTPAIRFKGFGGEWVEKRTIELCSISTGKNNTQDKIHEGKYPFYVRSPVIERSNNYLFDEEAVLTVGDGVGTGKVYHYVNGKYDLHQRVYRMYDFNGVTGKYFFYFFANNFYNRVISMTAKTSVDSVRMEMIADMVIKVPVIEEQIAIANLFQQLDTLINQHQQKHEKLQCVKKALLTKMFPKQGETQPVIRFKGFSAAWEEKALGDVANGYDNLRIPVTAKDRISGNTPYYGANGIQDYVDGYTHNGEFILIAEDGANDLNNYPVQYVNGKIWVNNHAHVLQAKENIADTSYLKYSISQTDIEPFLVGGGRAKLNAGTMMKILINIAKDKKEQTQIGKLFQQLDTLISQHQTQLTKLNNIKQAMLAKMFV